jgi:uncharacterized membrane protein
MTLATVAGIVFMLMGVGMYADAEVSAQAAAAWLPKERQPEMARAYKFGGAAFVILGLYLLTGRIQPPPATPRAGLLLLGAALLLAFSRRADLHGGLRWGTSLARWTGWAQVAVLGAAGVKLLLF